MSESLVTQTERGGLILRISTQNPLIGLALGLQDIRAFGGEGLLLDGEGTFQYFYGAPYHQQRILSGWMNDGSAREFDRASTVLSKNRPYLLMSDGKGDVIVTPDGDVMPDNMFDGVDWIPVSERDREAVYAGRADGGLKTYILKDRMSTERRWHSMVFAEDVHDLHQNQLPHELDRMGARVVSDAVDGWGVWAFRLKDLDWAEIDLRAKQVRGAKQDIVVS